MHQIPKTTKFLIMLLIFQIKKSYLWDEMDISLRIIDKKIKILDTNVNRIYCQASGYCQKIN